MSLFMARNRHDRLGRDCPVSWVERKSDFERGKSVDGPTTDIGPYPHFAGKPASALSKCPFEPLRCRLLSVGPVMRRREFLGVLAGVAVLPLAARAQQPNGMRRIAVLTSGNADDQLFKSAFAAFQQEL